MNFTTFEPQLTSTPKKNNKRYSIIPNLCSTRRSSLSKCTQPFPVHSSTPNSKQIKKSFQPDIHRLIYPSNIPTNPIKIWVL